MTVLMLRALGLGDLLTAVPAIRGVARAFASSRRVLATPAAFASLVERIGGVDALHDASGLDPLGDVGDVEVAFNLHGSGPQSHRVLLATRPWRLVAFEHPDIVESAGSPRWDADEHEVARWCRLVRANGIDADERDLDLEVEPEPAFDGVTVIHPGAASAARRWPVGRWAAVARAERDAGRRVVVTGSSAEEPSAKRVADIAGLPASSLLAGRTDVGALASIVAAAAVVLCGDTGIAHLATATRTPSVVLFGPTPPSTWGPPPDRPWHVALWAGRRGDPHGDTADEGLLEIHVDDVIEAVARARASAPERFAAVATGASG
jgi:ADP-heptose:LPS heptosyltransferase